MNQSNRFSNALEILYVGHQEERNTRAIHKIRHSLYTDKKNNKKIKIKTSLLIPPFDAYALFGTKRHSSKRMMYKKRPKTKESTQTPNAIKKLLEDMTTEPLPVPDPKSEQEEIEFFIGEKETPKNNEQRALANGFTGFSDEGEDDDSDEDENGDSDEL
ncbi:hypothetical protein BC941DRAFT_409511, partial [Chlamydoabsidia padenii]